MFCDQCGREVSEEYVICPYCGHRLKDDPQQAVPVDQSLPTNLPPVMKKPSGRRSKLKLFATIAVSAAAVVCVSLVIVLAVLNTPEKRFQRSMEKAIKDISEYTSSMYANNIFYGRDINNIRLKADASVVVGDAATKYLNMANVNIDSGEKVSANIDISRKGNSASGKASLKTKQGKKISFSAAAKDLKSSKPEFYLYSKELSDKGISFKPDLGDYSGQEYSDYLNYYMLTLCNFMDKETLNKEVYKYGKIVITNLDAVDKSDTTINVNGVSEKVTELSVDLDSDYISDVLDEVVDTLKDDSSMENAYKKMISSAGSYRNFYYKSYDQLMNAIENEASSLDYSDIGEGTLSVYLKGSIGTDIVGMEFEYSPEDSDGSYDLDFSLVMPREWNRWGLEADYEIGEDRFEVEGSGTGKNSALSGQLDIKKNGTYMGKVGFDEFNLISTLNGLPNGGISFNPSVDGAYALYDDSTVANVLSDFTFALDFKYSLDQRAIDIKVKDGSDLFASGVLSYEVSNAGAISGPASVDYIDSNDFYDYLSTVNYDVIEGICSELGVPESALSDLEESLMGY